MQLPKTPCVYVYLVYYYIYSPGSTVGTGAVVEGGVIKVAKLEKKQNNKPIILHAYPLPTLPMLCIIINYIIII